MRKVYYDQDATMVNYYAELLEGEGLKVMVKNLEAQFAAGEVPFQTVYPEVWVMNDEDYDRAVELIREMRDGAGEVDFSGVDFDEGGEERPVSDDVGGKFNFVTFSREGGKALVILWLVFPLLALVWVVVTYLMN